MARRLTNVLLFIFVLATATLASDRREQVDLNRLMADPVALNKLVIAYSAPGRATLYVFGTGRVVKQSVSTLISQSQGLVPTCTGQIGQDKLKDLVRTFIEYRFFALPVRWYAFITASDEREGFWKALRLHSIAVGDGENVASRQFAAGVYEGKQESIPPDFSAI